MKPSKQKITSVNCVSKAAYFLKGFLRLITGVEMEKRVEKMSKGIKVFVVQGTGPEFKSLTN